MKCQICGKEAEQNQTLCRNCIIDKLSDKKNQTEGKMKSISLSHEDLEFLKKIIVCGPRRGGEKRIRFKTTNQIPNEIEVIGTVAFPIFQQGFDYAGQWGMNELPGSIPVYWFRLIPDGERQEKVYRLDQVWDVVEVVE